jgi:glycosyltransferase involved in cell wall biosynthesis
MSMPSLATPTANTAFAGLISIVAPLYNEVANVAQLVSRVSAVMAQHGYDYELILVNDGSRDQSWALMQELAAHDRHLVAIDLAGNYGQTLSLRAGFERARGEVIIAMDGDLQHDPAYIPQFISLINEGYDMVGGAKAKRPEGPVATALATTAHGIIRRLSGVQLRYFGATYKAYRSYLVKNVELLGDAHRFLGALVARKGLRYCEFPIEIHERQFGQSNYKISKLFYVILDLFILRFFIVHGRKPFRLFGLAGLLSLLLGGGLAGQFLVRSIFFGLNIFDTYPLEFIFSLFMLLGGIFLLCFGVLAEIGMYIYYSRHTRTPYVVRQVAESPRAKA